MKFYEVFKPYHALIKAQNLDKARDMYKSLVSRQDTEPAFIEVNKDYAIALLSLTKSKCGSIPTMEQILIELDHTKQNLLIIK